MKKVLFISLILATLYACSNKDGFVIQLKGETISQAQEERKPKQNHFFAPKLPEEIFFAGEKVEFNDIDLKERLDNELIINNFWHSSTIFMLKRANRWFPEIKEILKQENVPEDLIYIALAESGFTNAVSPAGAKGFWQIMEAAGKEYGLVINKEVDERYHLEKSTRAACGYLKKAYQKFGTWALATAAYNRGMNGIQRDIEEQGVTNYFDLSLNQETARYFFRILAIKLIIENPKEYGFHLDKEDLYPPYKTKDVVVNSSIPNIHEWAIQQGVNTKILRKLNPWIIGQKLTVTENDFIVKLPKNNEQLAPIKG